ncbi:BTB domain-containing protein [Mycena sanguinolenta]|uniref:BTB domain-containing protein n=1 Tax=Mycena sanguinolenta TaxID=230812 RepID=A0A8H6YM14_9AGAR|nr:BTB domain-containing protein [Mycena sanguinolenta]
MDMAEVSGAQEQPKAPTRVEDLWFAPDMIVIRAEDKMFRVLGSILAAKSAVFRDMITFPQPEDGGTEKMDGFPVVRLHDSAEEVEVFLRAIFDSSYFMPAPAPFSLLAVLAILRLSHKYDVPFLYRRALDHLAVDGYYRKTYDEDGENHLTFAEEDSLGVALSVVSAVEVNAHWLLPYAYYCAATYSTEKLLGFLKDADAKMAPCALRALALHAHLVRALVAIEGSLAIRHPCATAEQCDGARNLALAGVLCTVSQSIVDPFPSKTAFEQETLSRLTADGMCGQCINAARAMRHNAASTIWNDLPGTCGLESWEDLHTMAEAAMRDDFNEGMSP